MNKLTSALNSAQVAIELKVSLDRLNEYCETSSHESVNALFIHIKTLTRAVIALHMENTDAYISQCNDIRDLPDTLQNWDEKSNEIWGGG